MNTNNGQEPESIQKKGMCLRNLMNGVRTKMFALFVFGIFLTSLSIKAQRIYNLNADVQPRTLRSSEYLLQEFLKEAKTARTFTINPALQRAGNLMLNDVINLQLFENNNYPATIRNIVTDVNGNFTLTLEMPDYPMAWAIITTSIAGKSLINVSIPELGLSFASRYSLDTNGYYLIEIDKNKIGCPNLENDAIEIPKSIEVDGNPALQLRSTKATDCGPTHSTNTDSFAKIDLLIVYTSAAANTPYTIQHGGINSVIASMIALGNTCLSNSKTGITLNLAHSAQVDYTETNDMYVSLPHLKDDGDGYMDNVHKLRKQYGADLVQLITTDSNSGGLGYLSSIDGFYSYGFSVVQIISVGDEYPCSVHELGHNMGLGHGAQHIKNISNGIFPYSNGWTWNGITSVYCGGQYTLKKASVMSYWSGENYADGINAYNVPYFSNPDISFEGQPTGDAKQADAARSLREMKHVIAYYSDKLANAPDLPSNIVVSSPTDNGATFSWDACANALFYNFYFSSDEGLTMVYSNLDTTSITFNFPSLLSPCTTYDFYIAAVNECDDYTFTTKHTFTTKCSEPDYKISTSSNPLEGGSTKGGGTINTDESCTVTAIANRGYSFVNWTENGTIVSTNADYTFTVSNQRNLVANFSPITYTVDYNGNRNTGGSTTSSSHTYDVTKALTSNGFTRAYTVSYDYNGNGAPNTTASAAYTFKEWNISQEGGSTSYINEQSVMNLTSTDKVTVTLYAQWNSATIIFPTPVRTGHQFSGWYTAASGGTKIGSGGETYTPTANITLYAQWIADLLITTSSTSNGRVSADKTTAIAGETVTLTISPDSGYELDIISVYKTDDASTEVALNGSGNTRTFKMPEYNVMINATFKKTQEQLSLEVINAAKAAIESGIYRISLATGNTEHDVKTWLISTLNVLFGQSYNVQFRSENTATIIGDVTIAAFTQAIAGTKAIPEGVNGSFLFRVTLNSNDIITTTGEIPGVIIATPYTETPVKTIELMPVNNLVVRIANTGNVATGKLTLVLSGANADVFTLSFTTIDDLAVGAEMYITLTPITDLAEKTYTAALTVNGDGMDSQSIDITYIVKNTGIEDFTQNKTLVAWIQNGLLHVDGLTFGKLWSIYNISGRLVYQSIANDEKVNIPLPANGVYLVKSEYSIVKVVF